MKINQTKKTFNPDVYIGSSFSALLTFPSYARSGLFSEEDQKNCFHYTNLQPLYAKDNMAKADKVGEVFYR